MSNVLDQYPAIETTPHLKYCISSIGRVKFASFALRRYTRPKECHTIAVNRFEDKKTIRTLLNHNVPYSTGIYRLEFYAQFAVRVRCYRLPFRKMAVKPRFVKEKLTSLCKTRTSVKCFASLAYASGATSALAAAEFEAASL
jgi:hypothetical protein